MIHPKDLNCGLVVVLNVKPFFIAAGLIIMIYNINKEISVVILIHFETFDVSLVIAINYENLCHMTPFDSRRFFSSRPRTPGLGHNSN